MINLKGNIMKSLFAIVLAAFAFSALAADAPAKKEEVKTAPAKVEKKAEAKPTKSEAKAGKKDEPKADVKAAK